jgi:signal transduction histidine kinase/ActR/RegA family two-component response regulator
MFALARFFRRESDPKAEREFRAAYQVPGVDLIIVGCGLTLLVFGGFFFLDYFSDLLPLFGGIQTFRALVVIVFAALVIIGLTKRQWMINHYALIVNFIVFFGLQAAAYSSYTSRANMPYAELYWALSSSMSTGTVVVFGASRLSVLNTLLLSLSGFVAAVGYALTPAVVHIPQLGRLVTHLVIVIIVCTLLRRTVEDRERQLFFIAKANLKRNLYTAELKSAKEAAERFLANMSHEIRTPMNGVLQVLDYVGQFAPAGQRNLVNVARASGQALLRILNGILDYTKLGSGNMDIKLEPVNIPAVIRTIADLYSASLRTKGLKLSQVIEIPPNLRLQTDEVKLFEVINNVVSNAIKFTNSGGTIEIVAKCLEIDPHRARLSVTVSDNGIGIANDDLDRLFTPFFQVDREANRTKGGTGIGLAISRQLVRLLGGEITVQSKFGSGTKVAFTIIGEFSIVALENEQWAPQEDQAARVFTRSGLQDISGTAVPAQLNIAQVELATGIAGASVLLVEDNELNALLMSAMLKSFGIETVFAENGLLGLTEFRDRRFDLILMDCQMPVMDGYESTQKIRELERSSPTMPRTPIIAVTSNTMLGDRERCLKSGMDDYIGKPYTRDELLDVLVRWIPLASDRI